MLPEEATLRATMAQHLTDTGCTNCADCQTLRFLLGALDAERLKTLSVQLKYDQLKETLTTYNTSV